MATSQEMLKISTLDMSLKYTNSKLQLYLPGTNELLLKTNRLIPLPLLSDLTLLLLILQSKV